MSKADSLPSVAHTVRVHDVDTLVKDYQVQAAYFQETGRFTVFKDDAHAVIDAFRTDTVLRITRGDAH